MVRPLVLAILIILCAGCITRDANRNVRISYSSGLHEGLGPILVDGKWGFVDKDGTIVIEATYNYVNHFSEGLARVRVGDEPKPKRGPSGLVGFVSRSGKMVIKPQFIRAGSFSQGRAYFVERTKQGKWKYGFIDKTGFWIVDPMFDQAMPFSDGMANVRTGSYWGYIDLTGITVIRPQFALAYPFSEGLAAVMVRDRWGYIDKTGNIIWRE